MSNRTEKAKEILSSGGYFYGFEGRDYYGKPIVKIILHDADGKKCKGFGQSTLLDLVEDEKIEYRGECYLPMLLRYRGFYLWALHHEKGVHEVIYRVYYSCGFWGDEIAKTKTEAMEKAKSFADEIGSQVVKIETRR